MGLLPELLSGTPFTVKSAENSRVWMYRIRASFSHEAFSPLPSARFAAPWLDVDPTIAADGSRYPSRQTAGARTFWMAW